MNIFIIKEYGIEGVKRLNWGQLGPTQIKNANDILSLDEKQRPILQG